MRKKFQTHLSKPDLFIKKLVHWGNGFDNFILFNSNIRSTQLNLYHSYDVLAGCGHLHMMTPNEGNNFSALNSFIEKYSDWKFGFLSYDLKNETERLNSKSKNKLHFPDIHFFIPKYVLYIHGHTLNIEYQADYSTINEIINVFNEIENMVIPGIKNHHLNEFKHKVGQLEYIKNVDQIKKHIAKGDIYEMNYCIEFFAENAEISPPILYLMLNEHSPAPFSCYSKTTDKYIISSSPERFLAKRNDKIISQPIKGTIKRGASVSEDLQLKKMLFSDEKERAENIMIVDLVRNDLSRIAKKGTVKVEELCGIYSYAHVHQMVSTISCLLDAENYTLADVLKKTFPMGSMTGAPKIKAMELIDKFELNSRGLYSGTIGYISPNHDFDFNVIIRSFLYNQSLKYLSYSVGSAITYKSIPKKEFDECLLKAKGISQLI